MATVRQLVQNGYSYQRITHLRRQLISQIRFLSTANVADTVSAEEHGSSQRKPRYQNTVLRVLASTVKSLQDKPPFGFVDDPFLMPRSLLRKQEYLKAMESGREAASYVLKHHPDIVRLREPVPDWRESLETFKAGEDEETLNYYISNDMLMEAVELFEKLQTSGVTLSLLTLNRVLDLVGFHGVGNDLMDSSKEKNGVNKDDDSDSSSSSSSSSDSDSGSDEDEGEKTQEEERETGRVKTDKVSKNSTWRYDNYAETLFSGMREKNATSYEVLILALLKASHQGHAYLQREVSNFCKFGETERAFEFYDAMRSHGFQGSAFLYSSLIAKIHLLPLMKQEKWEKAMTLLENMKTEPGVMPDVGVFNNLLELCYIMSEEAPRLSLQIINEMIAIGIEPSLASYLFVLKIHSSRSVYTPSLMLAIINRLKHQHLSIRNERDADFFSVAMATVKEHSDAESAKELYGLAFSSGNDRFLHQKSRVFLANYLCTLAYAEKNVDFVFQEYDRLVPQVFSPREWNYADLFRRIAREKQPWRIPRLYSDIKESNIYLGLSLIKNLLKAMDCDIPANSKEDLLSVLEDLKETIQNTEFEAVPLLVDHLTRLYALNGKFHSARENIREFVAKGCHPSQSSLNELLIACMKESNVDDVMSTVEMMANMKMAPDENLKEDVLSSLELSVNQRRYINGLVGS